MNEGYGIGAYTLTEAGHLLGVSPATIRRWLLGYDYRQGDGSRSQPPLWRGQYGSHQDDPLLGFRDLIEARVVRGLRQLKIGLPTIRECLARAAEIAKDDHPFSTRSLKTDRKNIFMEITKGNGAPELIELKSRQHVFQKIVEQTFVDLDFDSDIASRWWLLPNKKTIVLDPERSFGQPIVAESGVPTARLAQAVEAEGSIDRVAQLFELKRTLVRDALRFERREYLKRAA